jgi:2,3-bisphosphoglycerate-dependent phosphoglycerate mutase
MFTLVLVRHGESLWNLEKKFTGWTDVDLSEHGISEAHRGASLLIENKYSFDVAFTSVLKRAIRTLWIVLDDMDLLWIPVQRSWRLNERNYGALQGLSEEEMVEKVGAEQVHLWRRSYDIRPPPLAENDKRHPRFDPRYAHLDPRELPAVESLKDTLDRVLPYWHQTIAPVVKKGQRVLISAHGNSLRALVKYLDHIPDEQIPHLEIPNGYPLVYELDEDLHAVRSHYLGSTEEIERAKDASATLITEE